MKEKKHLLGKIWKYRKQITEGIANTIIKKQFVETVAEYRKDICDKCEENNGECLIPGTGPCCGACGCVLKYKIRSMSSACGLVQIGKEPKWYPVLSVKDDDEHINGLGIEDEE